MGQQLAPGIKLDYWSKQPFKLGYGRHPFRTARTGYALEVEGLIEGLCGYGDL
jgi:hypothetical protein